MKVIMTMILVMSLMLCLWGCGGNTDPTVPISQTSAATDTETVALRGTILALTDTSLTVQTEAGEQTYLLTEGTRYYRSFGRSDFRPDSMGPNEGQQPPEPPTGGQQPPQPPVDGQQPPEPPVDGQQPPTDGQEPTEGESSTAGGFTPGNGTQGGSTPPATPGEQGSFDPNSGPMEPRVITREELAVGDRVSLTLDDQGTVLTLTVEGGKPQSMDQPPIPQETATSSKQS